jgi:pantoate--beta-alanine ligase
MNGDFHYHVAPMEIVTRLSRMSAISAKLISTEMQIGLVPTMGVIHPGHVSLIEAAREMTDLVVVSIFAHRMLFLSEQEYLQYPRDFTKDVDLLSQLNVDYVFSPSEEEMFPVNHSTYIQVEKFGERLTGNLQPVFWRGLTTTTMKMIHIVRPSFLFLGLKDALQGAILRKMIRDLSLRTEVVVTPVTRHPSGLAHGTRNIFLTDAQKAAASVLYRSLKLAEEAITGGARQTKKVIQEIKRTVESEPMAEFEFAFVANPESLDPVSKIVGTVLIGVGAKIGTTSLNDSLLAESPAE